MNKKLISNCCKKEVWWKGNLNGKGNNICSGCGKALFNREIRECEVIEEPIPQPIQKEEKEMELSDFSDKNREYTDLECGKDVFMVTGTIDIKDVKNPTPSDTFIEEKGKEIRFMLIDLCDGMLISTQKERIEIEQFLKSSLQEQKEQIKTDLLRIADNGEIEDLRREVLNYFNKELPF